MNHLLYCLLSNSNQLSLENTPVSGVENQPVHIVTYDDLSVACSKLAGLAPPYEVAQLLTYERVIETFHANQSIIPLRYGCVLDGEKDIIDFLLTRRSFYKNLLKEIDGCLEMGLRILLPKPIPIKLERVPQPLPGTSGKAYLIARKTCYDQNDNQLKDYEGLINRIQQQLNGLFIKTKQEISQLEDNQLVSLYYLIRKSAENDFRRAFQQYYNKNEQIKILLSGPWPPYNFVSSSPLKEALTLPV